jgi:hypothetical protein
MLIRIVVFLLLTFPAASAQLKFAVAGDSRNCGDVVMPLIAADAAQHGAKFYWHLGDLRWSSNVDQDIQLRAGRKEKMTQAEYERAAWPDFIENQIAAFGKMPFYPGIGNHEMVKPRTREGFVTTFKTWLDSPTLKKQRLQDDPSAIDRKTYFHWIQGGTDFIYLDNATRDQFDDQQMNWFGAVLDRAAKNKKVHTIVVGMHAALPDSLASNHSMSDYPQQAESGRKAYRQLLDFRSRTHKPVYVLASHTHFFIANVFNTEANREHNAVLPGWIVGTAGAFNYKLPETAKEADIAKTNVYGYLLGTVERDGTVQFDFREVKESDVTPSLREKFGPDVMNYCFHENQEK